MPKNEETEIERRLVRWMMILGAAAVVGAAASMHGRFATGLAAGAVIAIVGYVWLLDAMDAVLVSDTPRITKKVAIKLILRYPILLGVLYLFYRTRWLPVVAVLAGLLIPLAGAVVECVYQVADMVFFARPSRLR
ncbi:MAG: ATP synthase subunit I [Terriglobia bacterium]